MKFNKIILGLAAGLAFVGAASCTDEVEYTPSAPAPVTKYYFPTSNLTWRDLLDGDKGFNVTIARADATNEETVTFDYSCTPQQAFEAPTSVTFAAGQGTTTFPVTFDLANVTVNQEYKLTFSLAGIENTPYSYGTLEITCLYLPWRSVGPEDAGSMGIYREDIMTTFFNVDNVQYPVEIQEHPTTDGLYRLVEPYGEAYPYNEPGDYTEALNYWVMDCTNPDAVVPDIFYTGMAWNDYGQVIIISLASNNMAGGETKDQQISKGLVGSLVDGIITMPKNSIYVGMRNYNWPNIYPANSNGLFKVVLPGYEDKPDWESLGWCEFTDGLTASIGGEPGRKYKVLVERSTIQKGQYRIVNLFGAASGYVDEDPATPVYTEINAANSACVQIHSTETPFKDRLRGQISVTTQADIEIGEGADVDNLIYEGIGAQLEKGVLRIPGDQVRYTYARGNTIGVPNNPTDAILDMSNPEPVVEAPAATATAANIPFVKGKMIPVEILKRQYSIKANIK